MYSAVALGVMLLGESLLELESPSLRMKEQCHPVCAQSPQCIAFVVTASQSCAFFSAITRGQRSANSVTYLKDSNDLKRLKVAPEVLHKELCESRQEDEGPECHIGAGMIEKCSQQCNKEVCKGFSVDCDGRCTTFSTETTDTPGNGKNSKYFMAADPDEFEPRCDSRWVKYNRSCYLFVNNVTMKAPVAEDACVSRGAHLASIHSKDESDFLYSISGGQKYWIGMGNYNNSEWKWTDGSAVDYTEWCSICPNDAYRYAVDWGYVGYVQSSSSWDDYDGNYNSNYYVCKSNLY